MLDFCLSFPTWTLNWVEIDYSMINLRSLSTVLRQVQWLVLIKKLYKKQNQRTPYRDNWIRPPTFWTPITITILSGQDVKSKMRAKSSILQSLLIDSKYQPSSKTERLPNLLNGSSRESTNWLQPTNSMIWLRSMRTQKIVFTLELFLIYLAQEMLMICTNSSKNMHLKSRMRATSITCPMMTEVKMMRVLKPSTNSSNG